MKKKDIFYIGTAVLIFALAGGLIFSQLTKKSSANKVVKVEVITPISGDIDEAALSKLTDPNFARNFNPSIDLNSGLGNPAPFNPI